MDNFTDLKITEYKSKINDEIVEDIFKILREENSKSILSKISKKVFIKYLNLLINSKNIYLFTLTVNEQIAFDIDEYVAGNSDMNSLWVDLPSWVQMTMTGLQLLTRRVSNKFSCCLHEAQRSGVLSNSQLV